MIRFCYVAAFALRSWTITKLLSNTKYNWFSIYHNFMRFLKMCFKKQTNAEAQKSKKTKYPFILSFRSGCPIICILLLTSQTSIQVKQLFSHEVSEEVSVVRQNLPIFKFRNWLLLKLILKSSKTKSATNCFVTNVNRLALTFIYFIRIHFGFIHDRAGSYLVTNYLSVQTVVDHFTCSVHLTCMSLGCWRELELSQEIHKRTQTKEEHDNPQLSQHRLRISRRITKLVSCEI